MTPGPLFLGLDLSTQALKATLLDVHLSGVDEVHVRFDADLPQFHTRGGVLPSGDALLDRPDQAAAPVAMYVAALDLLWERIAHERHWPVRNIVAISCAGQQHASVYLSEDACGRLGRADAARPLAEQLGHGFFSRVVVPNWQDATTLLECDELISFANAQWGTGYVPALCRVTGSIAHTRFTGAQLLRWRKDHPQQYVETAHILLVSNFLATLLGAGTMRRVAPLDQSDACGMNLWDMSAPTPHWSDALLRFVSKEERLDKHAHRQRGTEALGGHERLERMLGRVLPDPAEPLGFVGGWLQQRYGLHPHCLLAQGTGDNPATLQSLTPRYGEAVISLGTSDTILLPSHTYAPDPHYHVFAHPVHRGGDCATPRYFLMFVYKNGSLTREWVRDTYCGGDWDTFNAALAEGGEQHPERQGVGFYWLRPEILPWDARGVHRFARSGTHWERVNDFAEQRHNARALVQSQFLDFRMRIARVLAGAQGQRLQRVYAVGGAAENRALCQMLANVLDCEVARPVLRGRAAHSAEHVAYNFCSVGAAYRACWTWECARSEHKPSFEQCIADARASGGLSAPYEVVATPQAERARAYAEFAPCWEELEIGASQESTRPQSCWG